MPLLLLPMLVALGAHVQLDVDSWRYFGRAVLVAMLVSVVEELLFRGPLFWGVERVFGKAWLAASLTGALFFLAHVWRYAWHIDSYVWFICCGTIAVSVLRCRSSGFFKGLIFHCCMNTVGYFFMGLAAPPFPVIRKHAIDLTFPEFYAVAGFVALLATALLFTTEKKLSRATAAG